MSDGFEGVDGTDGVEGVLETGGVELEPPPHAATNAVNRTKGKARTKRRVIIAEPPRTKRRELDHDAEAVVDSGDQRQKFSALKGYGAVRERFRYKA